MVWLAQIAVTHAWTGRGPKTRLTPMLMAFCKAETEFALIEGLATDRFQLPASLAKEVFRLAHEGDRVATEIITTSAQELAINVNAVIKQLDLKDQTFDLILIGGVFNAGALYLEPFLNTVRAFAPGINVISLTLPPVIGAILLAGEAAGIHPHQIRPRVIESFNILHAKISHI
jgi:N-acetylglucosamine kinase-like BadF-type ATPase